MNTKIKHWLFILEIIKSELIYSPYDNDVLRRVTELIKEMEEAMSTR
jgi:hypothetical protein